MTEAMPKPESIDTPGWVNETPAAPIYSLCMFDSDGGPAQEVTMSRTEFITLKRWLAAWRGYHFTALAEDFEQFENQERDAKKIEITQAEIRMVFDLERVADALLLNFRRRLARGAAVEDGKWRLSDQLGDPIEEYEGDLRNCGMDRCGLTIKLAEQERADHAR